MFQFRMIDAILSKDALKVEARAFGLRTTAPRRTKSPHNETSYMH